MSSLVSDEVQTEVSRNNEVSPFQRWHNRVKLQCYTAFYKLSIVLCQTHCFMMSSGDLSVLHLMVSYKCWEGFSSPWRWFMCVCVFAHECLAGRRGAWGSAMPSTVVYLGLVHAPSGGVDPQGTLPQYSSISGCANLATILWHPRFSSGPAFSLLSSLNLTLCFPDET